ncbi:lysozyme [Nitratireductor basaltis]|uniref:Lysozyme n=1 Tax=Nitratireductor basaltis TaxID=472175 RepID=A0A084UBI6_9HYPH|nr:hypothetical protein [Nitratireductor basaltis]KFB10322.1 Transmembrane protein [Nitratireductor basaltis]
MRVDFNVAMEVAAHEALVRQAYKDVKGVLTWCVGMTNATGHRVERYIGKRATLQHCMNVYVWALTNYAEQVKEVFKDHPLTQAQFAAAVSFHWNTGAIRSATWVTHFKAGDMKRAREAFLQWRIPAAIIERREKEARLLFDGIWSNDGTMLEFTRVRPNLSIDWSSGRKTSVREEIRLAFEKMDRPELDQVPQPYAKPEQPTLSADEIAKIEKPTVPPQVEDEVKKKTGRWGWLTGLATGAGAGISRVFDADWSTVLAIGGVGLAVLAGGVLMRKQIIAAVREIRDAVEGT